MPLVTVQPVSPDCNPNATLAHHVGTPPTSFKNPWPSARNLALSEILSVRFGKDRNFIEVPKSRDELVKIRQPDWGYQSDPDGIGLKATWLGHASWLIETPLSPDGPFTANDSTDNGIQHRGVRLMLDPVFSQRTSPVSWLGPKRYSETPCTLSELPEVDICLISHSHYDHLDLSTVKHLFAANKHMHFCCGLGNASWFQSCGISPQNVTELDWWQGITVNVAGVGGVRLTATPAQHNSGRTGFDKDRTLWCSWTIEDVSKERLPGKKVYFAGDTGYRAVTKPCPTAEEEALAPHCPAFEEIGNIFGPFDLALLPIGLCMPRDFMSSVHCAPEDAICLHRDLKSKKSVGMHYGTFRGGLSAQYEDVRVPPRRWQELCEQAGMWGKETTLCDIGETVIV